MHVTLISACERRAIKRTNAVLDSYAIRTGQRTWQSPMTTEGMREVRAALRRGATRQTAVACYVNLGMRRMRLLWIVGAQDKFGINGAFPVAYTTKKQRPAPHWVRPVALLARMAGLLHDLGKASTLFQDKLRGATGKFQADPVRHEWISLLLYRAIREGKTWAEAWASLPSWFNKKVVDLPLALPWLAQGLNSLEDALEFLIVSHHQLLGAEISNYERDKPYLTQADGKRRASTDKGPFSRPNAPHAGTASFVPAGEFAPVLWQELAHLRQRLHRLTADKPPEFWWPFALQARAALIFADHKISGAELPYLPTAEMYANTYAKGFYKGKLKQALPAHLSTVGECAAESASQMARQRLPGLSPEAVTRITAASDSQGRFAWQNRAAQCLEDLRESSQRPVLVFNLAGTGAGKTRMNARAACVLSTETAVRFATVLNLRTLTLQTGDALRHQLHIGADEMAVVIGSQILQTLHQQHAPTSFADPDENNPEDDFLGLGERFTLPYWLAHLNDKRNMAAIIMAPVLVATIDYLIAAGEPQRQGHHVNAWLRVMDSDLILDEVDSYDPKALVAVLRLVQMAAMAGRNLICSSATLALPVAQAIEQAFASGLRLHQQLRGIEAEGHAGHIVLIDNQLSPSVLHVNHRTHNDSLAKPSDAPAADFATHYQTHLQRLCAHLAQQPLYRIPYLVNIIPKSQLSALDPQDAEYGAEALPKLAWLQTVQQAAYQLHQDQQWQLAGTGKSVSFGLIRVANIKTAIWLAQALLTRLPEAQIACYHADDFLIQRHLKEQRLDQLLSRQHGNQAIAQDAEISALVTASTAASVPFIVVATPVEEIGRDHDFDWAVIEPSSTQSIVQTAGRVNRHRLHVQDPSKPNVALLNYNLRHINNRMANTDAACFVLPGLEGANEHRYPEQALNKLIDWAYLKEQPSLDARLRFATAHHRFAKLDDESLTRQLRQPLEILCQQRAGNPYPADLMAESFYTMYPLRERSQTDAVRLNAADEFELFTHDGIEAKWVLLSGSTIKQQRPPRMPWLGADFATLREACRTAGIGEEEGLSVNLRRYAEGQSFIFITGMGFLRQ